MTMVVQFTSSEEAKALPILLRHSPGAILRGPTYILDQNAVDALRAAGVRFTELCRNDR